MEIKFYNTLSREKEIFLPINKKEVRMYTCGPTVYNYAHIGNLRAYVFADVLKRTLFCNGYKVKHIMNLTDIDDKTILNSQKEGKNLKDFTEFYSEEFIKDITSLNVLLPTKFTKATKYVNQMVGLIKILLEKGLAYKSSDLSTYYDIRKFKNYGKLSNLVLSEQKENAAGRIQADEYEKDNVQDFALWKAWDERDGDVYWNTELGKGRPGWHIECSAMSMANLGEQIDIHTGGVDNIFPHHENEIAQSEGVTGKKFVNYWMHNEWVLVDNKRMGKSFGNFFTLRDVIKNKINPISYRYWLLTANYRTRVNFTWEVLNGSETALKRLYNAYSSLKKVPFWKKMLGFGGSVNIEYKQKFLEYINDDLNTPEAMSLLWTLIKDEKITDYDKVSTILEFDKVLGLGFSSFKNINKKEELLPREVEELIKERESARKNKDWGKSDELRDEIKKLGYEVKDLPSGQEINKL